MISVTDSTTIDNWVSILGYGVIVIGKILWGKNERISYPSKALLYKYCSHSDT